jgi:hypothetical protein
MLLLVSMVLKDSQEVQACALKVRISNFHFVLQSLKQTKKFFKLNYNFVIKCIFDLLLTFGESIGNCLVRNLFFEFFFFFLEEKKRKY